MTRLLCTGDLHLGAHPEYGRAPGDRLADQVRVLEQIATLAFNHNVDAVLNCGDTFEGPGIPPEQLDVYARFVEACHAIDVPVIAITGNGKHDAAMRSVNGMEIFNRIPGITVCSMPRIVEVAGCAIACLPWVSPSRLVAARNGGDRDALNREAAELLVATARGLRAVIPDGTTAVLAYHGSISGASLPAGIPTDELREPVIDLYDLEQADFDAIVASHIHVPQFSTDSTWKQPLEGGAVVRTPHNCMLYTGSPMPLNFGEVNVGHGVWLLELRDDGVRADFVPIDSPQFVTIDFDFVDSDLSMIDLFVPEIPAGAIVRVRYRATAEQARSFDVGLLRLELANAGAAVVKVVPEIVRQDRARVDGVSEDLAPLDAFDLWLDANDYPGDAVQLRERAGHYLEAVS